MRPLLGMVFLLAAEPAPTNEPLAPETEPMKTYSAGMPTLGGLQFWADVYLLNDWRVQRNVYSGDCRLLDGSDRRYVLGDEKTCLDAMKRIREQQNLVADRRPAVLLLHGLGRTWKSMRPIGRYLESKGYAPYYVAYPSTRRPVAEHAENLRRIVARLDGPEAIHLVGYSLGGLVVRAYLAGDYDARIKRVILLGTPNQGAHKADLWDGNWAYQKIMGPAGQELGTGEEGIVTSLPDTLPVEFGIIAGGKGDGKGYSFVLTGDDDRTVAVESTRLPGASDFVIVRSIHSFLINRREAHEYIASFLLHGYFRSAEQRQPIPLPQETATPGGAKKTP